MFASLLMEYSHKYNDMVQLCWQTQHSWGPSIKAQICFMKLLQIVKWLEFQVSTVEEFRVMVRQFITNR